MDAKPNIGLEIKRRRAQLRINQEELAFRSELADSFLQNVELGNQQLTLHTLFKVSVGLETEPEKLIHAAWISWKANLNNK
ncbi:helix-turn-helix domain-containing protein [Marinibactrum halimedae]|nr:helix-turn-helix transcriptional regulator [Marinibactrum halimedae]MCD9458823.1 helix-turn-helix domain-containing protein [Marinibactrum halimedae]